MPIGPPSRRRLAQHLIGVSFVAGIGLTVSLLVADLSFSGAMLDAAKIAVLTASTVSALAVGLWLLTVHVRTHRRGSGPISGSPALVS
jgi:NhaA family Na+:H+ antiporter